MRLRLFIQRNRLPPTKIWWDTSSFEPGDDHNVSTLLSRVGQIVPMESGGWGLEDYAVEVDGFEVLHFQEVEKVIREGDEVIIRPLTTTEIRQRRASGRRQISTSGRKLLDGTPFGRPMISTRPAPDRPRLSIPPRKRMRTGGNIDYSTLVQVGSEDEDESDDGSYKESDEEEEVSEVGDGEGEEEAVEADVEANVEAGIEADAESDEAEESYEEEEDNIDEMDFEGLSRDYENPLMDYFDSDEDTSSKVSRSEETSQLKAICGARDTQSLQGQNGSFQEDSSEDGGDYTGGENSQDSDLSDESDSSDNATNDNEESMEVDIVGQAGHFFLPDDFYSDPSAVDNTVDSPKLPQLFQSEDMSQEVEEGERESEREHSNLTASSVPPGPEQDEDSSSSSEDSSDSEQSDESEKVGVPKDDKGSKKASQNRAPSTSQEPPSSRSSVPIEEPKKHAVALGTLPYQGKSGTKARNERKKQRRKNERLLSELINTGVLPKGSTIDDLKYQEKQNPKNVDEKLSPKLQQRRIGGGGEKKTIPEPSEKQVTEQPSRDATDRLAQKAQQGQQSNDLPDEGANKKGQRKKLRKAFTKAKKKKSIPVDWDFSRWLIEREKRAGLKDQHNNMDFEKGADGDVSMESTGKPVELSSKVPSAQNGISPFYDQPPPPPPHRDPVIPAQVRSRLRAPRKIVYNEDGIPNPVYAGFEEQQHEVEDPEAWREKIVLSAVECEQEGVEMAVPEFPFKQPTYQPGFGREATGSNKRRRNGGTKKKKQRQQDKENYSYDYGYQEYEDPGYGDWEGHDYYDDSTVAPTFAKDKATEMTEANPVDDLPPLPEDIASLYPLTKPVLPGTIVAFKQLMLTENYTPIMANYRTAIVQAVHAQEKDGPALELRLAVRDRPKRRIDPETGEKILRKFEMPGDEDEDEGFLDLMFGQLLEAKVVKLPEGANLDQDMNGDEGAGTGGDTQENNSVHQRSEGDANHETSEGADSSPPDIQVNATLFDGLVPLSAEPSQDQEQDLELDLGPETQAAQPQESLKSPSPVHGVLGTAVSLSSAPTSQAETSIPPIFDNEEIDPSYELDSVSDSDGLESLESMFASSQRIKPEPSSQKSPILPPLSVFSPLGATVEGDDQQSQRQIQEEATSEKRTAVKATRRNRAPDGAKISTAEVQIIDLTETSDPIVLEDSPRGKRGGSRSKGKGKQWRAVME
ncbi:hypothetical protein L873DRAFT_1799479 [Choiromyces venosus 120613-1]|uniref:DUF7357 domain-containing protein n=1 Tax=Choiromyces venosus 120613-1 TaxID=1336337 RepID=A0A3N4K1S3_9PEZI|nr:hypothetical protein L873DRAFT_1799479 [Choiromyces venosus 120613-1]